MKALLFLAFKNLICFILAPLVGLEPTTYRLTAERSTNWAKEEYINLAITYLLNRVTRKYCRHIGAWLLCSEWEQVLPPCNHHQKSFVYSKLNSFETISYYLLFVNILYNIFQKNWILAHSKIYRRNKLNRFCLVTLIIFTIISLVLLNRG